MSFATPSPTAGVPCRRRRVAAAFLVGLLACGAVACDRPATRDGEEGAAGVYEMRASSREGGTGRFYMGREIAEVVGHSAVDWLERPMRETSELPSRVVSGLELRSSDVVADIGAGTGYFTFRISPHVPLGQVYAVDIQPEMLDTVRARMEATDVSNVVPVLGSKTDPNLPPSAVDVALIVYTYSQFSHPHEMMQNIFEALRPGGRVIIVEYRGEDPTVPVDPIYKITEAQARKELEALGFEFRENGAFLPQQHFMVFEKPVE